MARSNENHTKQNNIDDWEKALHLITTKLNKVCENTSNYSYALIGSGAYVMHGVKYDNPKNNPNDIDITTASLLATRKAIQELKEEGRIDVKEEEDSSFTVIKFLITDKETGKSFEFEFTHAEDFGFTTANVEEKNGVRVTSLEETLLSIYLRPEHREKDRIAFIDLIRNNVEILQNSSNLKSIQNAGLQQAVVNLVELFTNPELVSMANNPEVVYKAVQQMLPNQPSIVSQSMFQNRQASERLEKTRRQTAQQAQSRNNRHMATTEETGKKRNKKT